MEMTKKIIYVYNLAKQIPSALLLKKKEFGYIITERNDIHIRGVP
jgi:hypothetical protein